MADTKISALTAGTPGVLTDVLPAARASANVRLTLQDILAVVSGTYGGWGQSGAHAALFGKANGSLAANADLDITTTGAAVLIFVRQNSDNGVGLFAAEIGLGTVGEIYDSNARFTVGADPGAASSQIWVTTIAGPGIRLRNRYAATKSISVAVLSLGGTPA